MNWDSALTLTTTSIINRWASQPVRPIEYQFTDDKMTKKTLVILRFCCLVVVLLSLFGLFSTVQNASAAMPTPTRTRTPTRAPTRTPTRAPTRTPTKAPTRTPTKTPTRTPTKTPTRTPTRTSTNNPYPPPATQYFITPDPSKNEKIFLPLLLKNYHPYHVKSLSYYMWQYLRQSA